MATRRGQETKNYFKIFIEGVEISGFTKVQGLSTTTKIVDSIDDNKMLIVKQPGPSSCGNITLFKKRTRDQPFWNWFKEVQAGNIVKKNITVELVYRNKPLRGWKLIDCWPCRWAISDITDEVLNTIEEIELVVEGIELL